MSFQLKNISQPAASTTEDIEWRSFPMPKVKKWLRRSHTAAYALGVATVIYVNHFAPAELKAGATPTTVITQPVGKVLGP